MKSRIAFAALAAAASLAVAGCGDKQDVVTHADTEGIWIDAGAVDYHIQASRLLEPGQTPDAAYLRGVPAGVPAPTGKEVWFAVFLRIENRTDHPAPTAKDFEVVDTQGDVYSPFELDPKVNPFAYQPTTLQPDKVIPVPDSPQDFDSVSGAELLFKLPLDSYSNRPLEFRVHSADGSAPVEASIDLDV